MSARMKRKGVRDECGVGEDSGGEFSFLLLQLVDAFFDGVLAEELVNKHRIVLADAVGAVRRLGLSGRVPPGVVVDHSVGSG